MLSKLEKQGAWMFGSPAQDASSGMSAFGDLLLFVGTLGFLFLLVTALAVSLFRKPAKPG